MVHQAPSHPARILSDLLGSPDVFGRRGIKGSDRPHVSSSHDRPRLAPVSSGPGAAFFAWQNTVARDLLAFGQNRRGLSSAGRAAESHSAGHRFDPDRLHQIVASPEFGGAYQWFVCAPSARQAPPTCFVAEPQNTPRRGGRRHGALAQLGEHLLCKQRVIGSIPIGSTRKQAGAERGPEGQGR